jgi:hypothetical protein
MMNMLGISQPNVLYFNMAKTPMNVLCQVLLSMPVSRFGGGITDASSSAL